MNCASLFDSDFQSMDSPTEEVSKSDREKFEVIEIDMGETKIPGKTQPVVVIVPPKSTNKDDTEAQTSIEKRYRILMDAARTLADSIAQQRWQARSEHQSKSSGASRRIEAKKIAIKESYLTQRKALADEAISFFSNLSQQVDVFEKIVGPGTYNQEIIESCREGNRPRPALLRIGGIALGNEVDTPMTPGVIEFLNSRNLVIRANRVEEAAPMIHSLLTRLLVQNSPGQVLLNVIDPDVTTICAPFVRLRDLNTSLAPNISTTSSEIEKLLQDLQSTLTINSQLLQGGWSSLGDFVEDRNGEEKVPFQVLVVLAQTKRENNSRDKTLQTILRQGPKLGISTIIVEVAKKDGEEKFSFDESNFETIDLRGAPRWLRFPSLRFAPDQAPSITEIRERCEQVARKALVESAPLIDLEKLVGTGDAIWDKSSAERIDVLVGRGGAETVSFTLGDSTENLHNVLIGGTVGTGKSNLLLTMVYSIAAAYSPTEVEMYLLDFKEGVEFARFARKDSYLPHAKLVGIQADPRLGQGVLKGILKELERRSKEFLTNNVTNLASYRQVTGRPMARLLLVIDEFQELFNDESISNENADLLESVVRRGRSFGIHVILASQTVSGIKGMSRNRDAIFDQFRVRIALRLNREESQVILDRLNDSASQLRNRGEAILNTESGQRDGNRQVVIAYASDSTLSNLSAKFHSKDHGEPPEILQRGILASHQKYERSLSEVGPQHAAVIGSSLSFGENSITFDGIGLSGRHMLMVGDGDQEACGVIHAYSDSLSWRMRSALQVVILGRAHPATELILNREIWLDRIRQRGTQVHEVDCFGEIGDLLEKRTGSTTCLIALGMHDLAESTRDGLERNSEVLRDIAENGHQKGISFFGWWQNISALTNQFGFDWSRQLLGRIALKTDTSTIREVVGSAGFGVGPIPGRILYLDAAHSSSPEFVIPFKPFEREA